MLGLPGGAARARAGQPPQLDGIAHVAFRVTDVAASREFYRKLGFEQAFEFSDANGVTTSYVQVNDRQFIELYRRGPAAEPVGLMHLCFDTGNIEQLREAYLERGLAPAAAVKARAGNLLFSLRDPEGRLLEYTQYLPGSLHWKARGKFEGQRRISEHLVTAAIAVTDLAAERAFYAAQLGFEDLGGTHTAWLRVPGQSGELVELERATPEWKPRLEFAVADVGQAAARLRASGLAVQVGDDAASVRDPDGTVVAFIANQDETARQILRLERQSLEGWQKGDPDPLLATLDPEITYIHAVTPRRLEGLPAVKAFFERYRGMPLFDSFEMADPKVQISGNVAVLTYLFVRRNGTVTSRWNATEVYRHNPEGWRVLHTHWSMVQPPATAPGN